MWPVLKMTLQTFSTWVLILTSVVGLTFFIERWWYFFVLRRLDRDGFMKKIVESLQKGAKDSALQECLSNQHPLCRIVAVGLKNYRLAKADIHDLVSSQIAKEQIALEKNLGVLGTISNIAPMLGLFGTVTGIVRAFYNIAVTGSGGSSVVAMGVAEALVATAIGICIAVPASISYNYFSRKVAVIMTEMESVREELLVWLDK